MRQQARYVATVRKYAEVRLFGCTWTGWPMSFTSPPNSKHTERWELTETGAYFVRTVWEVKPRWDAA